MLFVDKPSFCGSPSRWIEYGPVFPLGYVDDGAQYSGRRFHSRRVPINDSGREYHCRWIRFAHLDALDWSAMQAKRRLYSIRETDAGDSGLRMRWRRNSPRFLKDMVFASRSVPPDVNAVFYDSGIDVGKLKRPRPLWWDIESLRRFRKNGFRRYWWDDIWDAPWERILEEALAAGVSGMPAAIERPTKVISLSRTISISAFHRVYAIRQRARNAVRPHRHGGPERKTLAER